MILYNQNPLETLDYEVVWTPQLSGDTITVSTWSSTPAGIALTLPTVAGSKTRIFAANGANKTVYTIRNTVQTAGGRTFINEFQIRFSTAAQPLTATELQALYLGGMKLEDAQGRPISTRTLEMRISAARASFERKLGIRLEPTIIKLGSEPLDGEPVADERFSGHDYHPDQGLDERQYELRLPIAPIREVYKLALRLPLRGLLKFNSSWAAPSARTPMIRVYPTQDYDYTFTNALNAYGVVPGGLGGVIPGGWHITYLSGFTSDELRGEFADVLSAFAKAAALEVLSPGSIDGFLARGISGQSVGVDGLSQSTQLMQNANTTKYAAIMAQYKGELAEWQDTFLSSYRGITSRIFWVGGG